MLTNAAGLPLAVSAANTPDSLALILLVQAVPAVRSRRGPRRRRPGKLHADKGYDYPHLRTWLRRRCITPRIARRGAETSEKLGRHRGVIERSLAWLTGYRRLTLHYERSARLFTSFLTLAATLTATRNPPPETRPKRTHGQLGLTGYGSDWAGMWERLRDAAVKALTTIREEVETLIEERALQRGDRSNVMLTLRLCLAASGRGI